MRGTDLGRVGRGVALAVAIAAGVAGCLPAPATEQARAVSDLWTWFVVAAAGVGALVWGLITIALIRYRRGAARAGTIPPQIHDAPRLEIAWTIGPIVLVLLLFWLTMGTLDRIDARTPGRVTVDVTGFRWQWRFDYPGTGVSISGGPDQPAEMVVPAGEPIHIVLTSTDVVHSFYVPQFLFKRDAIPGRPNEFDLTIDEPGAYGGQCAEFCGVFHDRMTMTVRAMTRVDYDAWLAGKQASGSASPVASGSTASPAASGSAAP